MTMAAPSPVLEPDAIFNRDGELVWSAVAWDDGGKHSRTFYYDVHVDAPINPFSGTEETYIGPDPSSPPDSNWGWYRDGAGGVSFRVRSKR
jgi:hypothetical protein